MEQSISLQKLKLFKQLDELATKIKERPKYTTVNKQRFKTENIPIYAQGDAKFVSAFIANCNPLCDIGFIVDEKKNKAKGVVIKTDLEISIDELQNSINENYDFAKSKNEFQILEDITLIINGSLISIYQEKGTFNTQNEIHTYLETFKKYLENCKEALKCFDFNSKKTILSICQLNIDFCDNALELISDFDPSEVKWRL